MLILILWSNSFKICNIECQRLLQPRLEPGFSYEVFHSFNKLLLSGHLGKVKIIKCLRIPCRVHQSPLAMYHWYRDQPNIKRQAGPSSYSFSICAFICIHAPEGTQSSKAYKRSFYLGHAFLLWIVSIKRLFFRAHFSFVNYFY